MIHRTHFLAGTALAAVLALPTALSAQDSAAGGGAASTAPARAAQQDEGATTYTPEERAKTQRQVFAELRAEEIQHRERLATIHRLRKLAESQGPAGAEKLALLDKLEVKEGGRYNAASQYTANRLGDTAAYKQSMLKLAKGRLRSDELAQPVNSAKSKLTPEERKARSEARAAKKAAAPTTQPAKPDSPRHKKAEAAAAKLKAKREARSKSGADPAQPGNTTEPAKDPASGEEPKPTEGEPAPAPAEGGTPRSGS